MSDPGQDAQVSLREVTGETVRSICGQAVAKRPQGFYRKLGFKETGVKHGSEIEIKLSLE